jgi:hypothetical protein
MPSTIHPFHLAHPALPTIDCWAPRPQSDAQWVFVKLVRRFLSVEVEQAIRLRVEARPVFYRSVPFTIYAQMLTNYLSAVQRDAVFERFEAAEQERGWGAVSVSS